MFQLTTFLAIVVATTATINEPSDQFNWRIVGGQPAEPGQFPFIISLRIGNSLTCGGSLLGSRWVVTAAHCVYGGSPTSYTVVVGTNQLNTGGVSYSVKRIIVHADYNPGLIYNDIALLELERVVEETNLIQSIELDTQHVDEPQECTLIGWGRTSYPGDIPNDLQYLGVRSIPFDECKAKWSTNPIYETEICTLTKAGEGACHGDSGGPLITVKNGQIKLTGLVSWGSPCARGLPDVYTRVSSYVDWILKQILEA